MVYGESKLSAPFCSFPVFLLPARIEQAEGEGISYRGDSADCDGTGKRRLDRYCETRRPIWWSGNAANVSWNRKKDS